MRRLILISLAAVIGVFSILSCTKSKDPALESLEIYPGKLDMSVGQVFPLVSIAAPEEMTEMEVQWSSSAPDVVEVSETGDVKALKAGEAHITARCGDKEAHCVIFVTIPVLNLFFQYGDLTHSMHIGDILETNLRILPADATARKEISWINTNPSVARLETNVQGNPYKILITAESIGVTHICARCGGKTADLVVYVDEVEAASVTMSQNSLSMKAGESQQLTAAVQPSYLTNNEIIWESSNPEVATVENGLVTAHRGGATQISAWCGKQHDVCDIIVALPDGVVDLGLSVYWAECNLGASNAIAQGDYFAWGETSTKSTFTLLNYKLRKSGDNDSNIEFVRYTPSDWKSDFKDFNYANDAAREALGGEWRVPTPSEFVELFSNCDVEYYDYGGVGMKYMKFTSKVPGYTDRSVIFPVGGGFRDDTHGGFDYCGYYWSSSILAYKRCQWAHYVFFSNSKNIKTEISARDRYCGLSIRPVW